MNRQADMWSAVVASLVLFTSFTAELHQPAQYGLITSAISFSLEIPAAIELETYHPGFLGDYSIDIKSIINVRAMVLYPNVPIFISAT